MPDFNALFEVFGVYARAFTQFENLARRGLLFSGGGESFRSLDRLREEFIAVLNDSPPERDMLETLSLFHEAARGVEGWAARLQGHLETWIRGPLAAELGVRGASPQVVLAALARAMDAAGETVRRSSVNVASVTAAPQNAGNARCYAALMSVDPSETVQPNERARSQSISVECVKDAVQHRVAEGGEEFRATPEHGAAQPLWVIPVTVGAATDRRNVIIDGAFADYDSGSFTHWEALSGAAILSRDTTQFLFGGGALKISGNGATAAELVQDLAQRQPPLAVGRFWALGTWAYVSSLSAGSVMLDLLVDGSPSSLTHIISGSTPTGQWLHLGGFEYLPRQAHPGKVKVRVRCSADFSGVVLLDGVSLAPAVEMAHAGLQLALFQGSRPPLCAPMADRFEIVTLSDDAGAFQRLFRDRLHTALPSSDTPTVNDSLAE
ncbi:hypothetical protein EDM80_06035 [bacterium]|nr:MAG: hypothetical protein EDM80_06035 [bacterium]RIK63730.1 MAG: hypothetical protein DCC64_06345 [Planctomycetota bacterium]